MITVKKTNKLPAVKYADLVVGNLYTFTYGDLLTEKGSKDGFVYMVGVNTATKRKCAVILDVFGRCEDKVGNVFDLSPEKDGYDTAFSGVVTIKNT